MRKIADHFCGYLTIDEDKYTYNILNNIVTLLPAQSEKGKIYEDRDQISGGGY